MQPGRSQFMAAGACITPHGVHFCMTCFLVVAHKCMCLYRCMRWGMGSHVLNAGRLHQDAAGADSHAHPGWGADQSWALYGHGAHHGQAGGAAVHVCGHGSPAGACNPQCHGVLAGCGGLQACPGTGHMQAAGPPDTARKLPRTGLSAHAIPSAMAYSLAVEACRHALEPVACVQQEPQTAP